VAVAILEYVVGPESRHILLLKRNCEQPLVFEARDGRGSIGFRTLNLCARRLLIDFHGLPNGWEIDPHDSSRAALKLPPAVVVPKRTKAVLERNLLNPAFHYDLDYWSGEVGYALTSRSSSRPSGRL
jgi:hypothetical protein